MPAGLIHRKFATLAAPRLDLFAKMFLRKLHILHKFRRTKVLSVLIPDSHISYQHRASAFLHPNRNPVSFVIPEILDNRPDHRFDFGRMAGKYLAVNRHCRAFEHLRSLIEKAVDIVCINKTDFQRNRI